MNNKLFNPVSPPWVQTLCMGGSLMMSYFLFQNYPHKPFNYLLQSRVFFFFFFFLLFFVVTGGVWSSFPPALTSGLKPSSSQRLEALAANTGFPGGSVVKNLPAVQETWVRSLGWEDPLEKEMATHSSILPWRISWTEEPGGYSPWCCKRITRHLVTKQQEQLLLWEKQVLCPVSVGE